MAASHRGHIWPVGYLYLGYSCSHPHSHLATARHHSPEQYSASEIATLWRKRYNGGTLGIVVSIKTALHAGRCSPSSSPFLSRLGTISCSWSGSCSPTFYFCFSFTFFLNFIPSVADSLITRIKRPCARMCTQLVTGGRRK